MASDTNSIADRNPLSLPDNYVTVTFLAVVSHPPMLSLSMFYHHG